MTAADDLIRAAVEALPHDDWCDPDDECGCDCGREDDARAVLAVVLPAVAEHLREQSTRYAFASQAVLDLLPEETPQGRPYPHHPDELR